SGIRMTGIWIRRHMPYWILRSVSEQERNRFQISRQVMMQRLRFIWRINRQKRERCSNGSKSDVDRNMNLRRRTYRLMLCLEAAMLMWISASAQVPSEDSLWQTIRPYFSPPAAFQQQNGSYRPVLQFYDGRIVKNSQDWLARRK